MLCNSSLILAPGHIIYSISRYRAPQILMVFIQFQFNPSYLIQLYLMSFYCNCGIVLSVKEEKALIQHMNDCLSYPFLSEFCQLMEKKQFWAFNPTDLLILKADLKFQIQKIDNILDTNPDYNFQFDQGQPQLRQQYSDQNIVCRNCKKEFKSNTQFEQLWFLENCNDVICKICFASKCKEEYINKQGDVRCNCGKPFTNGDMISVIGQVKLNELIDKLNLKNQNLVTCFQCKEVFNFEQGNKDEKVKDQNNKAVEGVHLIHYINNRFKCSKCQTEQCKSCQSSPYHLNLTCEENKKRQDAVKCRLCDNPTEVNKKLPEALQTVCKSAECQQRAKSLCTKKLKCGHFCQGSNQTACLPCLNEQCAKDQNEDDYCNICFTEGLKSQVCVLLKCGHIFHEDCLKKKVEAKWNGPRIVFNFLMCPLCKQPIELEHPGFKQLLQQGQGLLKEVQDLSLQRFKLEEKEKDPDFVGPKNPFPNKPLEYAMHIYCYYECFKCKKPYFGGLKNCQAAAEQDNRVEFKKEDLVCTKCCPILTLEDKCPKHGVDFIDFKCRHCCSIALWFCHGTTHYCDPCHRNIKANMTKKCPGVGQCPLGIPHKPNGQEMSLGCSLCRADRLKAA